jgi:hypothetical protein
VIMKMWIEEIVSAILLFSVAYLAAIVILSL